MRRGAAGRTFPAKQRSAPLVSHAGPHGTAPVQFPRQRRFPGRPARRRGDAIAQRRARDEPEEAARGAPPGGGGARCLSGGALPQRRRRGRRIGESGLVGLPLNASQSQSKSLSHWASSPLEAVNVACVVSRLLLPTHCTQRLDV